MFNIILLTAIAGVLSYLGFRIYTRYSATTGSPWERVLATASGSATVLWQKVIAVGGMVLMGLGALSEVAGVPEVQTTIQTYLSPEIAGGALCVIALIGVWARLRTLGSQGDGGA